MPLRIELAPNERLILGDVSIRNGPRRTEIVIETQTRVLRERDIITEGEADTPCKRLYLALEAAYLSSDPVTAEGQFMSLARDIMAAAPSTGPMIARIFAATLRGDYYGALKQAKPLLDFEARHLTAPSGDGGTTGAAAA